MSICDHPERFIRLATCLKCGKSEAQIAEERAGGELPTNRTIPLTLPGLGPKEEAKDALCGCHLVTDGPGPVFVSMCPWHRKHLG